MKILMLGDSPTIDTGFGRVNRLIADKFVNAGHEVQFVGWCYQGEEHNLPYTIIPVDVQQDYWGVQPFTKALEEWKPDRIFTLGDTWMVEWVAKVKKDVKWVSYFPLDGTPIPPKWIPTIEKMDIPIVFSKFAQGLVSRQIPKKKVEFIYHGVDTKTFYPLDIKALKKEHGLEGKFIVGCVARNQPRKNIPDLIKAFAEFSIKKPNAILYLHMSKYDVGWDIEDLTIRHGLKGKVFTTEGLDPSHGVPDDVLNQVYNIFDIFVLPTMGEGFGLPILEAQACGIPVIVTDCSACSELIPYQEGRVKVKNYITTNSSVDHALIDTNDLVKKMDKFYYNKGLMQKCKEISLEFARTMNWDIFLPKFVELIERE